MEIKIENPMDYQVALYIRLSKEDENKGPSESVSNQKSMLNEFAARHRLLVYDTYIDDGWSGTRFERPAFQRMIEDIEAGMVNMVVTKDLSRLGRDYIMTGHYMERYFPENGVRYISLLDGIDTGVESSANDITPFRAIMNDMFAKDLSKKVRAVKRDKQRQGLFIGAKAMYGYKKHPADKNKLVVDEEVAPVIKRIFSIALTGATSREIADMLNKEGVPSPATYAGYTELMPDHYPGLWGYAGVASILRNETYIGNMVQGRMAKISYKSKNKRRQKRDKWVVVENTHEPLVDRETFQKVQMLMDSRTFNRRRTHYFLLKGLIFCHECGRPLGVINRKNTVGEDVLYFACRTYQRFSKAGGCASHYIKESFATEAIIDKVREECEAFLKPEQMVAETAENQTQRQVKHETEARELQQKINQQTAHLEKIYMDRLRGLLEEEDFERLYRRLQEERSTLKQKLDALQTKREDEAKKVARQLVQSTSINRELLFSLVERIELTEDKRVIIKFRFPELGVTEPSETLYSLKK